MYKPRAKKVCKLCKLDLTPWGEDRRTLCPDCVRSINETMVKCAGKCKKERPIKLMERVSLYFEPGKKGDGLRSDIRKTERAETFVRHPKSPLR